MNILYISSGKPTFVRKDIELLSAKYRVNSLHYTWNPLNTPFNFIKQFFQLTMRIKKVNAIFIMFAGYWSVLPAILGKIFNKKVFIILGGTDCVAYPAIKYGSLRKPLLKRAIYLSLKNASCLLPVHESLVDFTNTFYDGSKQGIRNLLKPIKTPVITVYNGYDPKVSLHTITTSNRIRNSFITVALINSHSRFMLKGIDLILEVAPLFPEARFTIIGIDEELKNKLEIPSNVTVFAPLVYERLSEKYLQSEFVIQVSISEGFPNALCEAMSLGCIPIVSPIGAIPKIVQHIGFTVDKRSREKLAESLRKALALNDSQKAELRKLAHSQIVNNFSEESRLGKIVQVIEDFKHME